MTKPISTIQTPLADEIRAKFLEFYQSKNHAEIPNISLVPQGDSTLLFTNSGMFPLVNYLSGAEHPLGKRLVNFQRCLRTGDDDFAEIGDWKHTTMFEMMGNWSLADYFKKDQINWVMELYVDIFGLDVNKLYVSVFAGDDDAPRDEESIAIWKDVFAKYGITAEVADVMFKDDAEGRSIAYSIETGEIVEGWNMEANPNVRIFLYPKKDNWWQRGNVAGELGGPDSEIFIDTGAFHDEQIWGAAHPNNDTPKFLEIGNSVFMQYRLDENLNWEQLPQKNVDFGGGFSRVLLAKQGVTDIFETEIFKPIIAKISEISSKKYKNEDGSENELTKFFRIIADHTFASVFVINDGVAPSRKEQGYILRRFIRRAVRMGKQLGIENSFLAEVSAVVIGIYAKHYPELGVNSNKIFNILTEEEERFQKTLVSGLKELKKLEIETEAQNKEITGQELFRIFETYGFPIELSLEELGIEGSNGEKIAKINKEFELAENKHKEMSRSGAEKKFTGGLADSSAETTILHTTHHLLLAGLQKVLGSEVHQRGSNITAERLRIDFAHAAKMTDEEKTEVERIVNEYIESGYIVKKILLPISLAETTNAEREFGTKYGETVNIYAIGRFSDGFDELSDEQKVEYLKSEQIISKEFCGGPHVSDLNEIKNAGSFKILKEESSGSGIRRIKANIS